MEGALIKRMLGSTGRTPLPPSVAYQQYIKGVPAVDYTMDTLIHRPRNPRTWKTYGFSPVEQVILTVNTAIRRALYQFQYYSEGSLPDTVFGTPKEWNADQIRQFGDWFNGLLSGNTAERRKVQFVPGGFEPFDLKEKALTDTYDEWLARIVCFALSIPPTPFIKQMNRATSEQTQETALEQGLIPRLIWGKGVIDYIIMKYFKRPDLHCVWESVKDIDPLVQSEIYKTYLQEYVLYPDEVRLKLGYDGPAPEKPLPPMLGQPTNEDGTPVEPTNGKNGGKKPAETVEKIERVKKKYY